MVYDNLLVEKNSFTTRMLINEEKENGYISYQEIDIKTDKEHFYSIWEKAESPNCSLSTIPNTSLKK
ncbi:hypothetical protein CYANOKiyG1_00810 [Okeania sp. KiyG1]|nr:hypothetical protein CYANOKiyG1_00810 [Okeania sp. KiyG1]